MEISKKQATLGGLVVVLAVLVVATAAGVLGGLAGYAIANERAIADGTYAYAPLVRSTVYSAEPSVTNMPSGDDGLRARVEDLDDWLSQLDSRFAILDQRVIALEGRAGRQMGADGEELLPFLLMLLAAISDGGWFGYDGMPDPVYPED